MKRNRKQPVQPPTGLCLDERNGVVVIADFAPEGGFDLHRAVLDEKRAVNITAPFLRTVVHDGNAHSEFAAVEVSAADSDETIITALLKTTAEQPSLIANFTRCPDGRILLTQAEELAIAQTNRKLEVWLEAQQPTHVDKLPYALRVETRARAIARAWHATAPTIPTETVAFLIVGSENYALGLWNQATGLAYETEEFFETGANSQIKCRHATEMLVRLIAAGTIEDLNLPPVANVIVSAPDDYQDMLFDVLRHNRDLAGIEIAPITLYSNPNEDPTPLDQPAALAIGALLDDPEVAPCDLNIALHEQLEDIHEANNQQAQAQSQSRAMRAAVAVLVPIVAVAAFAISSYADRVVERARLEARIVKEEELSKKLTKENADYESSKTNFAAFQSLLNNLIGLRQRQPAMEQLLRDLNQRWPREDSWFVSEINVKGQSVEIKGKTRNEQAITSFAKSLEFSDGLFTNILAKNNLQGATTNLSPAATQPPASNIIEFTVNATYKPLAAPGKSQADSLQQPALPQVPQAIPLTPQVPAASPRVPTSTPPPLSAPVNSPQSGVTQ